MSLELLFVHIPKTGGSSVNQSLESAYGRRAILKVWSAGDITPQDLAHWDPKAHPRIQVVAGHYNLSSDHPESLHTNPALSNLYLNGKVEALTVVRHPIHRLISSYNFLRNHRLHPMHSEILQVDPIEYLRAQTGNLQSTWLDVFQEGVLKKPANLHIIPTDHLDHALTSFIRRRTALRVATQRVNVTHERFKIQYAINLSDIPKADLTFLQDKHAHDLELYDLAMSQY